MTTRSQHNMQQEKLFLKTLYLSSVYLCCFVRCNFNKSVFHEHSMSILLIVLLESIKLFIMQAFQYTFDECSSTSKYYKTFMQQLHDAYNDH